MIAHLVNLSLSSGMFPSCLKISRVVPLFKGGDAMNISNYRPISVLNIFSKMIEKLVHKQLYEYLEVRNVLSDSQFGFRRNRSTTQALLRHTNHLYESLDENKLAFPSYLDLRKAFDSVNQRVLLSKMMHYGIRGLPHSWFCSYLANRQQYVNVNNAISEMHVVSHSVPQGSNLGPLLFLIYINDLSQVTDYFECVMFADDCALSCSFTRAEIPVIHHSINYNLEKVYKWLCANRIMLNSDKTKYILYSYKEDINLNHQNWSK